MSLVGLVSEKITSPTKILWASGLHSLLNDSLDVCDNSSSLFGPCPHWKQHAMPSKRPRNKMDVSKK